MKSETTMTRMGIRLLAGVVAWAWLSAGGPATAHAADTGKIRQCDQMCDNLAALDGRADNIIDLPNAMKRCSLMNPKAVGGTSYVDNPRATPSPAANLCFDNR